MSADGLRVFTFFVSLLHAICIQPRVAVQAARLITSQHVLRITPGVLTPRCGPMETFLHFPPVDRDRRFVSGCAMRTYVGSLSATT